MIVKIFICSLVAVMMIAIPAFLVIALFVIIRRFQQNKNEFEQIQKDSLELDKKIEENSNYFLIYNEKRKLVESCRCLKIDDMVYDKFKELHCALNDAESSIQETLNPPIDKNCNENADTDKRNPDKIIFNCLLNINTKIVKCHAVLDGYNAILSEKIIYTSFQSVLRGLKVLNKSQNKIAKRIAKKAVETQGKETKDAQEDHRADYLDILYKTTRMNSCLQNLLDCVKNAGQIINEELKGPKDIEISTSHIKKQATKNHQSLTKNANNQLDNLLLYIYALPIVGLLSSIIGLVCLMIAYLCKLIPKNMRSLFIQCDKSCIGILQQYSFANLSIADICCLVVLILLPVGVVCLLIWLIKKYICFPNKSNTIADSLTSADM